jgi:hypothetical protein
VAAKGENEGHYNFTALGGTRQASHEVVEVANGGLGNGHFRMD